MSWHYIANLLRIPQLTIELLCNFRTQKRFIRQYLVPDLDENKFKQQASNVDFERITNYYALAVPAILGEVHSQLHNQKMNMSDRLAGTLIGACSVLFDDFFDNDSLTDNYISSLINNPEQTKQTTQDVKLAVQLYTKTLSNVSQPTSIRDALNAVFQAQIRSRKQKGQEIDEDEIKSITFQKGGTAFLLYRKAFQELPSTEEELFYHTLGALMQLENDIFDVYKDREAHIKTLVTTTTDIKIVRNLYLYLINELFCISRQLSFSPKAKAKAMRQFMLVISRGLICLDQLEDLQKLTNDRFELMAYSRKELICDMEKPANFLKTIHYYAKFQF